MSLSPAKEQIYGAALVPSACRWSKPPDRFGEPRPPRSTICFRDN